MPWPGIEPCPSGQKSRALLVRPKRLDEDLKYIGIYKC